MVKSWLNPTYVKSVQSKNTDKLEINRVKKGFPSLRPVLEFSVYTFDRLDFAKL